MGNVKNSVAERTQSNGIESEVQDESNRSGNDTDTDDADIKPIYDEEPMDEEQITAKCDILLLNGQHILRNLKSLMKVGLTRKLFDSCTGKVDSESTHSSNVDISKIHECKQTLDLSAELESLFSPLFDEYFNGEYQVVSKSFAVTTADASDKRQQQPDLTSSTSTLATTVTADGNFDLYIFLFFSLY
ncbi:hypothetical protein Tco_1044481 [Tanacetum coccineum]|uniref:Uncharacterized protein n=1 Tax=Tanacetum coccineum TaxID=301880 RepID=A0ABQ5GRA0_9ASTR